VERDPLDDWLFTVDEVSSGVYRATGTDSAGRSVETKGVDPEATLAECKRRATEMADRLRRES
jgi:hypothetical protein